MYKNSIEIRTDKEKWHDYYYVCDSDQGYYNVRDPLIYRVNRAGLDNQLPKQFQVERDGDYTYSVLTFIFRGRGRVSYSGVTYEVGAGDLYILPAGHPHAYSSNPDAPIGQIWLEIDGGDSQLILESVVTKLGPIIKDELAKTISGKMSLLIQQLTLGDYYEVANLIYQMLLDLMYEKNSLQNRDSTEQVSRVQLAKSYIDSHVSESINNEKLADISGFSRSYFIKIFKETYHQSPQSYMMKQKIEAARHFLIHSDKSVEEIGIWFGFCTTSHFIKRFKQEVGMTPASYKRLGKECL